GLFEQSRQLKVGRRELAARINHHYDRRRLVQRNSGLTKNFGGDEIFFLGDDSAGVDYTEVISAPMRFAIKPVASDARLVADNRTARPDQPIEQRRFADVWTADDGDEGIGH